MDNIESPFHWFSSKIHQIVTMATVKLDFLEDDNSHLLVPVLVEGDKVTDIAVADIGLLRQHAGHKDVVHTKDPMVTALINLKRMVASLLDWLQLKVMKCKSH